MSTAIPILDTATTIIMLIIYRTQYKGKCYLNKNINWATSIKIIVCHIQRLHLYSIMIGPKPNPFANSAVTGLSNGETVRFTS